MSVEDRNGHPSAINIGTRLALALAVLELQITACTSKQGIEPLPSPTKPVSTEFTPTLEIITNPPVIGSTPETPVQSESYRITDQAEVLAIKVSERGTIKDVFDGFVSDPKIKELFKDPSTIEYSAMGIELHPVGSTQPITYPFFSAVSEEEGKGYTAMVTEIQLDPTKKLVIRSVLNRMVDQNGIVGLGITDDLQGKPLENPVMIFSTGLTETEIAEVTLDELLNRDIFFVPGEASIPRKSLPISAKVDALLIPEKNQVQEVVLNLDQKIERGLAPDAFAIEVKGEFEGVSVDVTFAISKSLADKLPGGGLKIVTPPGSELSGKERIMKGVLMAYYRLYLQREGLDFDKSNYSFEQYLADYKAGKDMKSNVYLVDPATGEGKIYQIDPSIPIVSVVTEKEKDPNGDAPLFITNAPGYRAGMGFYLLPNGNVKSVSMREYFGKSEPKKDLPYTITSSFNANLQYLSWPTSAQEHGPQFNENLINPNDKLMWEGWKNFCPIVDTTKGYCDLGDQIFQPIE